jgi:hypothetical protein
LFIQDSDERMEQLYSQLVPFGIKCQIIQTGDKPKKVKKLDPRAIPGVIVGYGPSTKQHRVLALPGAAPHRVYIERHVIVNAGHFQEYFTRSTAVAEVSRIHEHLYRMDVLNCARVHNVLFPHTLRPYQCVLHVRMRYLIHS